jgi:hypothetical protein
VDSGLSELTGIAKETCAQSAKVLDTVLAASEGSKALEVVGKHSWCVLVSEN